MLVWLVACAAETESGHPPAHSIGDAFVPSAWSSTGVTISITNGTSSGGYDFGMAQTGADGGWAGEDCLAQIPSGYDYMDDLGYQFCHHLPKDGGTLTTVDTPDQVVEGATTLLTQSADATITYAVFAETCWVWGDDTGYYEGCAVL